MPGLKSQNRTCLCVKLNLGGMNTQAYPLLQLPSMAWCCHPKLLCTMTFFLQHCISQWMQQLRQLLLTAVKRTVTLAPSASTARCMKNTSSGPSRMWQVLPNFSSVGRNAGEST